MQLQLTHAIHRQLRRDPTAVATVFGDRRRTWRELAERASRLAAALRNLGMGDGDRVALVALNSDRYFEYMLGVWWGGGALNPVNTRWSAAEVAFSLDDCDTRILLVDEHFAKWGEDYRARSKSLGHLIYFGDGEAPDGMLDGERLMAEARPIRCDRNPERTLGRAGPRGRCPARGCASDRGRTARALQAIHRRLQVPGQRRVPDSLPVSGAGKLQKHVLREPYWAGHKRYVG